MTSKSFFTSLLLACSVFLLKAEDRPLVLGTASMISDMAANIFGDKAKVENIVPIGGDPHMFEPTPATAHLVNEADMVLMNGLTFEGWIGKLVQGSGSNAKVVTVTEGIEPLQDAGHAGSPDPHAWMNVENVIVYARNIVEAAKALMPRHAEEFEANFQKYKAELEATDAYIERQVASIPEKHRILITSHDAFQYFGQKYGIRLEATMGVSTESDVNTADMVALQKTIKETGVPAIFVESTINPKLMQQIAKDNGIGIGGELFSDSLGDKESGAETYIKMMRKNTDTIVSALTAGKAENKAERAIGGKGKKACCGDNCKCKAECTCGNRCVCSLSNGVLLGAVILLGGFFFFLRRKSRKDANRH